MVYGVKVVVVEIGLTIYMMSRSPMFGRMSGVSGLIAEFMEIGHGKQMVMVIVGTFGNAHNADTKRNNVATTALTAAQI